jgi:hypothetical protein
MRRWTPVALAWLGLCLMGFSTYAPPQTSRFRWEVFKFGAAYNTATAEEANFSNPLTVLGQLGGQGSATFRTDGIQCTWAIAGSGGSNGVDVKIVHEDAGIDCQCTLGACNATAGTPLDCDCGAAVQLGSQGVYSVQLDDATDCTANPAGFHCSVDLWR